DPLALEFGGLGTARGLGGGFGLALALEFEPLLLLAQLGGLAIEQFALAKLFLLAQRDFAFVEGGFGRHLLGFQSGRARGAVALDEDPLLADLDLDRACLAGGIGLL